MWFSTSSLEHIDSKPSITPLIVKWVKSVLSRLEKKLLLGGCYCVSLCEPYEVLKLESEFN